MAIADIVLTTAMLLMVVATVQPLARRIGLPFTAILAIVGVLIGLVSHWLVRTNLTDELDEVAEMVIDIPTSSGTILTILLPMIPFQGAITTDVLRLAKDFVTVLLLEVLAALFSLVLTGGAVCMVA